jgi:hypothetical protein
MTDANAIRALREQVEALRKNAHNAGKEGQGTHRNAGDSGRVAALWMEDKRDLARAIEAQGGDL